jgi:hypothetical protein
MSTSLLYYETFAQLVTDFGPLNQFITQILCFISK